MFPLCRKGRVQGCVPVVYTGQSSRMCSRCVDRAEFKGVFPLCRKGRVQGCVPVV